MADPALIQSSAPQFAVGTVTLSGVTAGNALVAIAEQQNSSARTYTFSDNVNAAWTQLQQSNSNRQTIVGYFLNSAGGDIDVSVVSSGSDELDEWRAFEISATDIDVLLHGQANLGAASVDTFAGGTDLAAESMAWIALTATGATDWATPTGYTKESTIGDNDHWYGWRVFSGGDTGNTGTIIQSGATRPSSSIFVSFKNTGAPPVSNPNPMLYHNHFSGGL